MEKKITVGILGIVFLVLLLGGVYAKDYSLLCLGEGEAAEFSLCNPAMEDRICNSDSCQYCVFEGSTGAWCPANINLCNVFGAACGISGGNPPELDETPPILTIISPVEDGIYGDRKVLFNVSVDEPARVYYSEDGGDRWRTICRNLCTEKDVELTMDEGDNTILVKAVDAAGNEDVEEVSFFVDSKDPSISKTEPRRGFSDGEIYVKFREDHPENLKVVYGLPGDMEEQEFDIGSDCVYDGERYYECNVDADFSMFDGEEIEYWFVLEDIAGNIDESREREVDVDLTFPELINEGSFWEQGDGYYQKYVYFDMEIVEENLDEVYYTYVDSRDRLRDKRICSRLDEGRCEKKIRFSDGEWDITVVIVDEAGNAISYPVSFEVLD